MSGWLSTSIKSNAGYSPDNYRVAYILRPISYRLVFDTTAFQQTGLNQITPNTKQSHNECQVYQNPDPIDYRPY